MAPVAPPVLLPTFKAPSQPLCACCPSPTRGGSSLILLVHCCISRHTVGAQCTSLTARMTPCPHIQARLTSQRSSNPGGPLKEPWPLVGTPPPPTALGCGLTSTTGRPPAGVQGLEPRGLSCEAPSPAHPAWNPPLSSCLPPAGRAPPPPPQQGHSSLVPPRGIHEEPTGEQGVA